MVRVYLMYPANGTYIGPETAHPGALHAHCERRIADKLGLRRMGEGRWTNTSQQPVDASANILDATNVDPNLHFELRDENGHLLPRKVYNFPQTSGHAEFGILKAGESIAYDVNLLRLFDIKQSGKFALQVLRQIPQALGTGTVKSNTISITISE